MNDDTRRRERSSADRNITVIRQGAVYSLAGIHPNKQFAFEDLRMRLKDAIACLEALEKETDQSDLDRKAGEEFANGRNPYIVVETPTSS